MSDFASQFLAGTSAQTFTQESFDTALEEAKAEIMMMAMEAAKMAVKMEREECAKIADAMMNEDKTDAGEFWNKALAQVATQIRNRIPSQNQ